MPYKKFLFGLLVCPALSLAAHIFTVSAAPATYGHCTNFTPGYTSVLLDGAYTWADYAQGYLALHFHAHTANLTKNMPLRITLTPYDEECTPAYIARFANIEFSFTSTSVEYFSLRFSSPTHFDIWDDSSNLIVTDCQGCSGDVPYALPSYAEISAYVYSPYMSGYLTTATYPFYPVAGAAPIKTGTLPTPSGCNPGYMNGYFFDAYEHAEYLNGFLVWHFRFAGAFTDGRVWTSHATTYDADCRFVSKSFPFYGAPTYLPPHVRYWSVRFTSPTHWEIWNDSTNAKIDCYGCAQDLPDMRPHTYVSFFGWVDGSASTLSSTPFPVAEPVVQREPVIIIPGISGTELYNGDELIWPNLNRMLTDVGDEFLTENLSLDGNGNSLEAIQLGNVVVAVTTSIPIVGEIRLLNSFQGLLNNLENIGYVQNDTYFLFPYDWRLNLDITKDFLKQKIDQVKAQTGASKVNIIAHSMGGLLVKDYLHQYGPEAIDKLIFIGTPHLGAPKAAKVLLKGDNMSIPWLNPDRIKEVMANAPALYGLVPSQSYFSNLSGYMTPFIGDVFNYNQTKDFLLDQGLNANVFSQAETLFAKNLPDMDLAGIDAYNIAGCSSNTEAAYILGPADTIRHIAYTSGDETVPLGSAGYPPIPELKKYYAKNAKHAELPSAEDVRSAIINILSNDTVTTTNVFKNDSSFCGMRGKILSWFSPVEVHVYDAQNRHAGPIENNATEESIPGASYDSIGHYKFIFLPVDAGQQYRIEAQGTGPGTFDLLIDENIDGVVVDTTVFNDVPVRTSTRIRFGVSATTLDDAISIDQGAGAASVPADAVLSGSQGQDAAPPTTGLAVVGTPGLHGWFLSDAEVILTATDTNSGILRTVYSRDGGITFMQYNGSISVTSEGITTLQYYSVDRAGNDEVIKTLEIKIDKTSPEIETHFATRTRDFVFKAIDTLDQNPVLFCTQNSCSAQDIAGHTTTLDFQKYIVLGVNALTLKTVSYDGFTTKFPDNVVTAAYEEKSGAVKKFDQIFIVLKQMLLSVSYDPKRNESTIVSFSKSGGYVKEVAKGIRVLRVVTEDGKIVKLIE